MMLMKVFLLLSSEVFICNTVSKYLLLVWYSEEITGLETWHLNPAFRIY